MKPNKTLIASMVVMACTTLATSHSAFARYGQGTAPGTCLAGGTPVGSGVRLADGTCLAGGTCQTATYQMPSSEETATLVLMREEEKLARDVYLTLYNQWQLPVFNHIASSEQQQSDRIRALLQTYGVPDPVVDDTVGVFINQQLASLYAQLVTQGQASVQEALKVGALIEETDIADLQKAISATTHPDIAMVYTNLMRASQSHLSAFNSVGANLGAAMGVPVANGGGWRGGR